MCTALGLDGLIVFRNNAVAPVLCADSDGSPGTLSNRHDKDQRFKVQECDADFDWVV